MDKSQDVKRGANRFLKKQQSINNNKPSVFGAGFCGKSKKERFKKLGFVGEVSLSHEEHTMMGCEVSPPSNRENEISSQSQSFMNNNGSAKRFKLSKRSFKDCDGVDHVSVPRKLRSAMRKRNLESVSSSLPASKKLNLSPKKDGIKREKQEMELKSASGSITKDEEEVVETLYALASLFPDSDTANKTNKLDIATSLEASTLPLQVKKETQADAMKDIKEDSNFSGNLASPLKPIVQERVLVPSLAKTEQIDEKQLFKPENINIPPEQHPNSWLKPISANQTELPEGSALWPGLCSTASLDSGNHVLSKPLATEIPACIGGAAMCPSKYSSLETDHSTIKISEVANRKNLMKRCTSHVYIGHLIRVLQATQSKNSLGLSSNQVRHHEGLRHIVPNPVVINDPSLVRNGLNSIISGGSIVNSSAESNGNPYELANGLSLNENLQQDKSQVALAYGTQAPQKQSFDLLSLSSGDGKASTSEARHGLAPLSQIQFPHLHSLLQYHHQAKTFSMPQSCLMSSDHNNQLSMPVSAHQTHLQFPPYPRNPFSANSHTISSLAFAKQQQQQEQFWAAQYRSDTGNSMPLSQIPSSQTLMQGPLYYSRHNPAISQQQRLMTVVTSSLTKPRRSNCAPTLQLLCNEHI